MIEDILKIASPTAEQLAEAALAVNARVPASAPESAAALSAALEDARNLFRSVYPGPWRYIVGNLDMDRLIFCCEKNLIDWQQAFNAKCQFGTAKEVQALYRLKSGSISLQSGLSAAVKPYEISAEFHFAGNLEAVEELFRVGANATWGDADNRYTSLYQVALRAERLDIARVFGRYAEASGLDLRQCMESAKGSDPRLYQGLRQIYWEYGRFRAPDATTLIETKPLPPGNTTLKIVFNFLSRRVSEIYDFGMQTQQPVLKDFAFDEYQPQALEAAHQKLKELGGTPPDTDFTPLKKTAVNRTPLSRG